MLGDCSLCVQTHEIFNRYYKLVSCFYISRRVFEVLNTKKNCLNSLLRNLIFKTNKSQ